MVYHQVLQSLHDELLANQRCVVFPGAVVLRSRRRQFDAAEHCYVPAEDSKSTHSAPCSDGTTCYLLQNCFQSIIRGFCILVKQAWQHQQPPPPYLVTPALWFDFGVHILEAMLFVCAQIAQSLNIKWRVEVQGVRSPMCSLRMCGQDTPISTPTAFVLQVIEMKIKFLEDLVASPDERLTDNGTDRTYSRIHGLMWNTCELLQITSDMDCADVLVS